MNVSGYVRHVTICRRMFTIACCSEERLGLKLGLGLDLVSRFVSGYAHVFVLRSVVIVILPQFV